MPIPEFETLKNPPIHEAVLDVRVRARSDLLLDEMFVLGERLRDRFPKTERLRTMEATLQFDEGGSRTERTEARDVGLFLRSADEKLVLQLRVDGITLSRLAPYRSFDELGPLLSDCWSAYLSAARPKDIVRTAVRYINRFDVPSHVSLREWLADPPEPPADGLSISTYQHRQLWRTVDERIGAVLTTALQPSLAGQSRQVVVDIDAFSETAFPDVAAVPLQESIAWVQSNLEELRYLKNTIFFTTLSDRCLQLFR